MNKLGANVTKTVMSRAVDRTILDGKCIVLFRAALKSPYTLDPYERRLCRFLRYMNLTCDQFVRYAKKSPGSVERKIIEYSMKDRERLLEKDPEKRIAACTIANRLKPVRLLLEINDADKVNWKKIKRFLPAQRRFALDRAPTMDEIRKIYNVCDLRGKAMLLLLFSSGIREGAIETLSVRHLQTIERNGMTAARLVVYQGEAEEYLTFITPEANLAIQDYISYRKRAGEVIGPDSPLIRDKFEANVAENINNPRRCTPQMIRHYFNRLLVNYGFRTVKRKRHEFTIHGFRKAYKTRAEQAMKPINTEILMGHSVGISDHYYRPTETELLDDYLRAVPLLTVSEVEEVKHQMSLREKTLEEKLSQMEQRLASLLPLALAAAQGSLQQTVQNQART